MRAKLWDKTFKYTKAENTDIRKTFDRIRKELASNGKTSSTAKEINLPLKRSSGA